jgi:hypothetical protein
VTVAQRKHGFGDDSKHSEFDEAQSPTAPPVLPSQDGDRIHG